MTHDRRTGLAGGGPRPFPAISLLVLLLAFACSAGEGEDAEEEALAIALPALERALKPWRAAKGLTLEVIGEYVTTEPDPDGEDRRILQRAEYCSTREIGGERLLIHYRPRISRWHAGAREYYLEHQSIGFDGTRGYTTVEKEGGYPDARIRTSNEITLLKKPREFTTIQYDNGLGSFLPFHEFPGLPAGIAFDRKAFAELVARDHCQLTATREGERIRIGLVFGDLEAAHDRHVLELDSSRGFALVSMVRIFGAAMDEERPLTNTIECHDFRPIEGSDGLFFPRSSRFRIEANDSDFDTRVGLSSVRIRPTDPGEYEAPLPDGWTVYDAATARRWTIGGER